MKVTYFSFELFGIEQKEVKRNYNKKGSKTTKKQSKSLETRRENKASLSTLLENIHRLGQQP